MFLKNCWYVAAWDHEVTNDSPLARKILGEDVVLYRTSAGRVVAFVDRCCHRLAPLSIGRIEGDCLRCMYHGLLFDPDGKCIDIPQQDFIPPSLKQQTFPIIERHKYVWIWMGDPALSSTIEPNDAHWQDDPNWRYIPNYMHYDDASYMLITDNLLDLSHLGFVHESTLGGGRKSAEVRPKLERFDWGVRITRLYTDDAPPPYMRAMGVVKFDGPVDRWQMYEWHIRGNMLNMDFGLAPQGSGAFHGHFVPEALRFHTCQSLTPETEDTTHYFWMNAHGFALDRPEITESLSAQAALAFEEDKRMIQAQQRVVRDHPEARMNSLAADAAVNQIRARIKKMLAVEADVAQQVQAGSELV